MAIRTLTFNATPMESPPANAQKAGGARGKHNATKLSIIHLLSPRNCLLAGWC